MNLFQKIKEKIQEKKDERDRKCKELLAAFSCAVNEANSYASNQYEYVDVSLYEVWNRKYGELVYSTTDSRLRKFRKAGSINELNIQVNNARMISKTLRASLEKHNDKVAEAQINSAYSLIGDVEGRKLDRQQMLAVIKDVHNHLIIAGAGTGKTTTVVGKIKYLLKSGKCKPEDILVLSFTNASASEMSERIAKEAGCKITATTFHKLGLSIISKADGKKPKISQVDLGAFIRKQLKISMKDPAYVRTLSSYLLYNRVPAKSEFEFKNENEYREYLRLNPPVTIQNESVKSYGEMDIANFLFQNGVKYIYEADYMVDTRTAEYGQYHPDFYLPDYGIYIEYFGIDKNGNVPEWFSGKNGKTASEVYCESMEWKRKIHKENETILVECYSYEKFDGTLFSHLEDRLKEHGVVLSPKTPDELWSIVSQENNGILDGLVELFETVINLMKSNDYTIEDFRTLAGRSNNAAQRLSFVFLIEPIFVAYEKYLKENDEIDFNDMINIATECIRSGKVTNPFSYVIVDEYQDISKARFLLIDALRRSRDYDLFCVGDDWQSIYRFAGSDVNYILDFEKYWGPTVISKIETTYRFTNSLIEISGNFIMQNPAQIRKSISGMSNDMRFSLGEISGYSEKYAIEFMSAKIEDLPKNSTVYFIGRYSFDIDMLKDSELFECQYNNVSGFVDVNYKKRSDLKMTFLTAHKSKGLQADYVFIINNKSSRMGFPSKIQNDPILDLLLENNESYPYAEERRLYYVALTRARTKVYFLTVKDNESVFARELEANYEYKLKAERFACPICGGRLVRKTGPYGDFFGCENYRETGCTYTRKIRTKTENG